MQGRWTIFKWGAFSRIEGGPDTANVPVVPCDDAAIERGQAYLSPIIEALIARQGGPAWNAPDVRDWVQGVLRAAGETP